MDLESLGGPTAGAGDGAGNMDLESLGGLTMHIILSKIDPQDVANVACVSKRFKNWASDDMIWSGFCARDLDLSSPLDPLGNPMPCFKASYQSWRESFNLYPWPLVTRVKRCWATITDWLAINFPEISPTLRRGATEGEILELESTLKVKLPLPTRVLYRFFDGQEITGEPGNLLGLIGGYTFYDNLVNVSLLPLHQMVTETKAIIQHLGFGNQSKHVVVAASCGYNEKNFFLNCSNGQLYVGTRNLVTDGEMLPCVPNALIELKRGGQQQDALLLWLEEHGRRLQNGTIKVRKEGKVRSISLFPEEPPLCSVAVTNGVKVRASSVFVPEFSNLQDEIHKFFFAYSIRMSLSSQGCKMNGMTFNSCQLYRRRWIIRCNDTIVDDVNGEAVIGQYPLLRPGEEEFIYESCTTQPSSPGSVEGAFTFVPGRLADSKGSPFDAEVAKFPLLVPDYIF